MNLKVILSGFPELEKAAGKEMSVQTEERTLGGLLQHLERTHGVIFKGAFMVKILRNGQQQIVNQNWAGLLEDGDQITIFHMLAGG